MRRAPVLVAFALAAACGGRSASVQPAVTTATTTVATTVAAGTTTAAPAAATTSTTTPVVPTTTGTTTTTTTAVCVPTGTTGETSVAFPDRMSALVGHDIRTGAHPCFERVVIEFQNAADGVASELPGYRLHYEVSPILDSPSGLPMTVAGSAVLVVQFSAWMQTMEGVGYPGPWDITPTNVRHILQLKRAENFEGMASWAVGLDARYPYVVSTLDSPPRLVIDVFVS